MARIITPDFTQSQGSFLDMPGRYDLRRGLRIVYSKRLKDYIANHKRKDILIAAYRPHGHMAVCEENIQLVSEEFADDLVAKGIPYALGEMGRVLISNTWIPDNKNAVIQLDLTSWLGVKSVTAKGLKRQDVLRPFAPIMQRTD
ncbi:MAG: hypothetical protein IJ131_10655 [Eggerthellaceae bacterium]|nr:hypothetical protein [Eggerthellaceae bacterium]